LTSHFMSPILMSYFLFFSYYSPHRVLHSFPTRRSSDLSADGFETYGVTGVALITFILLAVPNETVRIQLLVWLFVMRIMMIIASAFSYFVNGAIAKARYANKDTMNFEAPLTSLVWITSIVSVALTFIVSYFIIPDLKGD